MPRFQSKLRCGRPKGGWNPQPLTCASSLFSTEFLKLRWRGGLSGRSPGRPQRIHPLPPPVEVRTAGQGGLSPVSLPGASVRAQSLEATPYPLQASD